MKIGKSLQELAAEIERQAASKKDYVAHLDAVSMTADAGKVKLRLGSLGEKGTFGVTEIAHSQIAEHTKIPKKYYDQMREKAPELLATNVDHWFRKYPAPQMLRTLDGNVRAMLSPSFNTLDNYDFAHAALPILLKRKLTIMSCEITERRLYIKAVDEQLFRDVPVGFKMGDGSHKIFTTCAPAVILSNSEVGFGRLVVETGVYERACTNLCLFAKGGMKRTHVGTKHKMLEGVSVEDLDAVLSNEAKKKTMEALWLQVRDVIGAAFDEKTVAARAEAFEVAAGRQITGNIPKVIEVLRDRFDLTENEGGSIIQHLYAGGSFNQYGLHAAITRAAQDLPDYDRATSFEYLGGKVLELPRTEWEQMAEAA